MQELLLGQRGACKRLAERWRWRKRRGEAFEMRSRCGAEEQGRCN